MLNQVRLVDIPYVFTRRTILSSSSDIMKEDPTLAFIDPLIITQKAVHSVAQIITKSDVENQICK